MELQIKVSTPTIEIPITAIDYSGKSATITIGFYRRKRKVAAFILEFLQTEKNSEARKQLLKSAPKSKFLASFDATTSEEEIVRKSIDYMKDLEIEYEGKDLKLDTRKLPEGLTESDIITAYLDDTTFYPAIISNYLKSLSTFDYKAAKLGN